MGDRPLAGIMTGMYPVDTLDEYDTILDYTRLYRINNNLDHVLIGPNVIDASYLIMAKFVHRK